MIQSLQRGAIVGAFSIKSSTEVLSISRWRYCTTDACHDCSLWPIRQGEGSRFCAWKRADPNLL